jgi:hypothetical protein
LQRNHLHSLQFVELFFCQYNVVFFHWAHSTS